MAATNKYYCRIRFTSQLSKMIMPTIWPVYRQWYWRSHHHWPLRVFIKTRIFGGVVTMRTTNVFQLLPMAVLVFACVGCTDQAMLDKLNAEKAGVEQQVAEASEKLEKLLAENQTLKQAADAANETVTQVKEAAAQAQTAAEQALATAKTEASDALAKAVAEVEAKMGSANAEVKQALEAANAKVAEVQQQLEAANAKVAELEAALKEASKPAEEESTPEEEN